MPRSLYPTIFCSTLVLLGAILLRPGTAQELLNLAKQMRGQAPDPTITPGYTPGMDPRLTRQLDSVPQAPTQPIAVRQPQSWPGGPGPQGDTGPNFPVQAGPPVSVAEQAKRLESAVIVGRIGSDSILASDTLGHYAAYAAAQAEGAPESALAPARAQLLEEIRNLADSKMLFAEAIKNIPAEAQKDIEQKINGEFQKTQVKDMMQRAKCNTPEELDAKLREAGTSLERRRKSFFEMSVARIWLQQQVKEKEISYADVFAYYQHNGTKFDHEAKARWEQLTIRFDRVSDKQAAYAAICKLGNDVLHGTPFTAAAKSGSQGPTAEMGGQRDWTTKGSLKSAALDQAIFGLPVMAMSQVIEDEDGFHIVRVIERKEAYRTPFIEAQVDIRKQLKMEQYKKESDTYLTKLRSQNPIWTIFDNQGPGVGGQGPAMADADSTNRR